MSLSYLSMKLWEPITEWAQARIKRIIEAKSDEDLYAVYDSTFSKDVNITLNGSSLSFDGMRTLLRERMAINDSQSVTSYDQGVEIAKDGTYRNQAGWVGTHFVVKILDRYVIQGEPTASERFYSVNMNIEMEDLDNDVDDTRKIVDWHEVSMEKAIPFDMEALKKKFAESFKLEAEEKEKQATLDTENEQADEGKDKSEGSTSIDKGTSQT